MAVQLGTATGRRREHAGTILRMQSNNDWNRPPVIVPTTGMNWLDKQYANSSWVLLIIAGLIMWPFALMGGLAGLVACRDREAKRKASAMLVSALVSAAIVFTLASIFRNNAPRERVDSAGYVHQPD